MGWPSWPQWRQLPNVLTRKERFLAIIFLVCALGFGVAALWAHYLETTVAVAEYGGIYTEALVGEPRFINPVLAGANDVDRDISALVYSGLMRYDPNGTIVPDLAERYEVSSDGKTYTFYLRKNVEWHDGKLFGPDDVVFTVGMITNPDYGSPLRVGWQGVVAQKTGDNEVQIILPQPYSQFLERATIGILPQHIWENVVPTNISLADANLKPVGTGPYRFDKFTKDKFGTIVSYALVANNHYWNGAPYISAMSFSFFNYDDDALAAYENGDVMGIANVSPARRKDVEGGGSVVHALDSPKYFAVFFNQNQSKVLVDKNVRMALAAATDKQGIIDHVLGGNGIPADSPLLPWMTGYNNNIPRYDFSVAHANEILDAAGWKDTSGDGVRKKKIGNDQDPTPLEITLATPDFPDLVQVANMLKSQWEQIGAKVNVESHNTDDLKQQIIRTRKYDALLFGEVLMLAADPYLLWHSSQKKDPGLNLSLYDNKNVDKLLEDIRGSLDPQARKADVEKVQDVIADEIPALFLYSPYYLYAVHSGVKNISAAIIDVPAQRFSEIERWYIHTKRIPKTP